MIYLLLNIIISTILVLISGLELVGVDLSYYRNLVEQYSVYIMVIIMIDLLLALRVVKPNKYSHAFVSYVIGMLMLIFYYNLF